MLALCAGLGLLMAGFAKTYGQLQRHERELISAYNQSEELMLRLGLRNEEYLRARQNAETANAAKTHFPANLRHELRTPLNALPGFPEALQQLPREKTREKTATDARNHNTANNVLQAI